MPPPWFQTGTGPASPVLALLDPGKIQRRAIGLQGKWGLAGEPFFSPAPSKQARPPENTPAALPCKLCPLRGSCSLAQMGSPGGLSLTHFGVHQQEAHLLTDTSHTVLHELYGGYLASTS